jgi:hypothetical protein
LSNWNIEPPDRDIENMVLVPVMISVEYQMDPKNIVAFKSLMKKSRVARLRQGAVSWSFFEEMLSKRREILGVLYLRRLGRIICDVLTASPPTT